MKRNPGLAAVAALWILASPALVLASEWPDGYQKANGTAQQAQPIGAFDGSSQRALRSDASGILRITEEYPMTTATANPFTAANAVPVTTTLTQIGNGWSAYPYGNRSLYVKRTATGGSTVDPLYLYLYASDDNVSFYPVCNPGAFSATFVTGTDTTKVDTVMVQIPSKGPTFEQVFSFPIETYGYMGKYLAIFGKRDSGASTVQNLTLVWMGRQK